MQSSDKIKSWNYKGSSRLKRILFTIIALFFISNPVSAQHRGDNLCFHGLANQNELGVKAAAMGGAFTSMSGDISSLFYNPAGLAKIDKLTFSATANYSTNSWRENQVYRPNRYFVTLPFYLEGLYIPDPAENGMFDHERLWNNQVMDTTYLVEFPELGLDPFGEEAADWKQEKNNFAFNNAAIAFPFEIAKQKFTVAASFNRKYNIEDFDRNDTYLNPHIGYDAYGEIGRVDGVDTLVMNWFRYERQRSGIINNFSAALAYKISEIFLVGASMNFMWGTTDDFQSLDQVGTFDLIQENRFRFSYVSSSETVSGKSDYSSSNFNFGVQADLEKFNVGIKINLPGKITKDWKYESAKKDSTSNSNLIINGKDEINLPLTFQVGISFNPVQNFIMSVDYSYSPYSKAEIKTAIVDPYFRNWADKQTLSFGMEYKPFDFLALMGGYQNSTEVFIPDGAAIRDKGPNYDIYSGGLSFNLLFGEINLAYQYKRLKYYDSYFSNTNYVTETYTNLLFGYTIGF